MEALRLGDDEGVAKALALVEGDKVEEVEEPPILPLQAEENVTLDLSDRCWKDGIDDIWMTDFPPPADFTGYESRPYDDIGDDEPYVRACTPEEAAILDADAAADRTAERAEDEQLRDVWFDLLRAEADPPPTPRCQGGETAPTHEPPLPPSQGGARGGCERQRALLDRGHAPN